jgi:hypothetical protein
VAQLFTIFLCVSILVGCRHVFPAQGEHDGIGVDRASGGLLVGGHQLQAFVDELKWLSAEGKFATLIVHSTQHDEDPSVGCHSHSSAQV